MHDATKAAYEKTTAAIREFAETFRANEPPPTRDEFELIAEEKRDLGRDLWNGYCEDDDDLLLDVYDGRIAEEEQ